MSIVYQRVMEITDKLRYIFGNEHFKSSYNNLTKNTGV